MEDEQYPFLFSGDCGSFLSTDTRYTYFLIRQRPAQNVRVDKMVDAISSGGIVTC